MALKVALAAGGTAGHINPALALAEELKRRGHEVSFYGQPNRLEATLVPEAGFDFFPTRISGFDRERPWTLISAFVRMTKAERAIGSHFQETGVPDVAVGFGAYVEMPLLRWCSRHDVPVVVHEQNSVPGLANKVCSGFARTLCLSLPEAMPAFEGKLGKDTKVVVTGNPVRRSVISATRTDGRRAFGVPEDARMLLVFGGSLGAHHLNEALCEMKDELLSRKDLYVVHSTGKDDAEFVEKTLALTPEEKKRYQVKPYISNMGEALAAADCVISRAGASSIAEIAALAVPSLLIPYPKATADHQTTNAHYLVDAGAAHLLPDAEVETERFREEVLSLVDNAEERGAMRKAAEGLGQAHAAAALADEVERAAQAKA